MKILSPGKLNIGPIDSSSWGSGGKSKISSWIASQEHVDFAVSQNGFQASHISVADDGFTYKFQHLPSAIFESKNPDIKVVLGADMVAGLETLLKEIADWKLGPDRLFIHPNAAFIQDSDRRWEEENLGYIGSTMTGVGAAKAHKMLRLKDKALTASDIPELRPYIANVNQMIADWLSVGHTGLLETAQGFDLSLDLIYSDLEGQVHKFWPAGTNRNVNPMSFYGSTFAPHKFIGQTIMNLRTYPIRVGDASTSGSSIAIKYVDGSENPAWEDKAREVQVNGQTTICVPSQIKALLAEGHEILDVEAGHKLVVSVITGIGSSGGIYPDQQELSWAEVSAQAGIDVEEKTSLTKRIRRVFTPSTIQLRNATMTCQPDVFSVNFVNYLDKEIAGKGGVISRSDLRGAYPKVWEFVQWVEANQYWAGTPYAGKVQLLGTGAKQSEIMLLVD